MAVSLRSNTHLWTRLLLQTRLAQVGRPACVLCEDFTFRANCPKNRVYIELRVKSVDFRRLCPRGIVVAEFSMVNSETQVGPKNIGTNSQETFVSGNRVIIPPQALVGPTFLQ